MEDKQKLTKKELNQIEDKMLADLHGKDIERIESGDQDTGVEFETAQDLFDMLDEKGKR